jgi:hypothetical protein
MVRMSLLGAALLLASSLAASVAQAQTGRNGAAEAERYARDLLERGVWRTCGLDARPSSQPSGLRCTDVGPYRIVERYGYLDGYVAGEGREPFAIWRSRSPDGQEARFLVVGPWQDDLAARLREAVALAGGRVAPTEGSGRQKDAEDFVKGFGRAQPDPKP